MTETEFYEKRQMWASKNGHLVLAPKGFPYSHFEWFCGLFGLEQAREWMSRSTRGYHINSQVVAYIGDDFKVVGCDLEAVEQVIKVFEAIHGPVLEVGFGSIGGKDKPWIPKTLKGTEQFLLQKDLRRLVEENKPGSADELF